MPRGDSAIHLGTPACADYVNDETERLMLFVTALELAGNNNGLPGGVAEEITGEPVPHGTFRGWFDRQIAETVLTRTVDGFLTYLADLLAMVYEANPNALPASANIPVSLALELDDRDALVRELAGRRIRRQSRQGIDALNRPFKALSFPLFRTERERKVIERAIAQRDLIVHSRGIVDRAYLRRVPGSKTRLGEPLALKRSWVVDDSVMLVETAVRVDEAAAERWGFDTVEIHMGSSTTSDIATLG
jgi:hypothetical protein